MPIMTSGKLNLDDVERLLVIAEQLAAVEQWNTFGVSVAPAPALELSANRTRRGIGHFASRKMSLRMPYVSSLERDLLYLLETDPAITGYLTQPMVLGYMDNDGTARSHLPDVITVAGTRTTLIEVKYFDEASQEDVQSRTKVLREALELHSISYRLLTERVIRAEPRLSAARMLARFRWHTPDPKVIFLLQELLGSGAQLTVKEAMSHFDQPIAAATSIFAAVLRGVLVIGRWADPIDHSVLVEADLSSPVVASTAS